MAVTKPPIFTSIADAEVSRNRPVSEELVRKMIQNCNLLSALAPIGSIRCVALNQPGATTPSTDQWQLADGEEITHPSSPLATLDPIQRFSPNFTNVYLRGAADDTNNNTGGSYTTNLSHSHTTGNVCGMTAGEEGNEQPAYGDGGCHSHTVSPDLSSAEPLEVAHQQVAIYIKIN